MIDPEAGMADQPDGRIPTGKHPAETERASDGRTRIEITRDLDEFHRYQVQMALELFDRVAKQNEQATSLYQRVIGLDGAAIALSITFLTAIANRANAAQAIHHTMWMLDTAWVLLALSIHSAYRVIVIRHNHIRYAFQSVQAQCSHYIHHHSALDSIMLSTLPVTEIKTNGVFDPSKAFAALADVSRSMADEAMKSMAEAPKKAAKAPKERARASILLAIAAIILLCVFAERALSLF